MTRAVAAERCFQSTGIETLLEERCPHDLDVWCSLMPEIPQRLYLAGPMSGVADCNFPLFHEVARRLRARGYEVFNPAENYDGGQRRTRAYYMQLDVPALLACEAIVLLPSWRKSRGASLEVWLAIDLGVPLYQYTLVDGEPVLEAMPAPELLRLPFDECGSVGLWPQRSVGPPWPT